LIWMALSSCLIFSSNSSLFGPSRRRHHLARQLDSDYTYEKLRQRAARKALADDRGGVFGVWTLRVSGSRELDFATSPRPATCMEYHARVTEVKENSDWFAFVASVIHLDSVADQDQFVEGEG
jgi:hypothetical protein